MALTVRDHGRRRAFTMVAALLLILITRISAQSDSTALQGRADARQFPPAVFNGTGEFAAEPQAVRASLPPSALAAADVDGDGYTDILAVCARTGTVEVLLNTKRQAFTSAGVYAVGPSPAAIACADVNGDGRMDIVTAGGSSVSVLLNAGSGRFAQAASIPVPGPLSALAIADLDADGAPDIAVINAPAQSVTFLKNDGTGSFISSLQILDTGVTPGSIALSDLNNDGRVDAVIGAAGSDSVSVFVNEGAGLFFHDMSYAVHAAPAALAVFDFDCDGFPDIATANSATHDVSILLNDRTGKFAVFGDFDVEGELPSMLCDGDIDADGDPDLIVACTGSNTITIMRNNGYAPPSTHILRSMAAPRSIAALNMSGSNGIVDIASANATDSTVSILKNSFYVLPPPELTLSTDTLIFPETAVNKRRKAGIVLSASIAPLTIDSVEAHSTVFSISLPMPAAIPSLGSLELPLTFRPRAIRSYTDTIVIHSSAGSRLVCLAGDSPVPEVILSAQHIPYGNVKERKSAVRTIVLRNPSLNDVVLDSAWTHTRWFAHSLPRRRIVQGDSLILPVRFSPDTLRAFADTLRLLTNTKRRTIPIALSGDSPVPTAILSAQSIQFGNVRLGDTARASLIVSNQSFNDVVIDTISGCSARFRVSRLKGRVAQADSLTLVVSFIPGAFRSYADTLRLRTNSNRHFIPVIVWGHSPAPVLLASAASVDFMKQEMKHSASKQLRLTNRSINSVTIDSLTLRTQRFKADIACLPLRLNTDDTASVTLSFRPDSTFFYTDTLFIHSSMLEEALAIVLSGEGELGASDRRLQAGVPERYSISQNYPNPFKGFTSIQFAVPQASSVIIRVYDVTGREIGEVFNNTVRPGYYTAQWNAAGVSSGIYFYRIRAASVESAAAYNETRKLVILK